VRIAARALLVMLVAGCAADGDAPLRLEGASPPYGPLVGGTRVTLTGRGFAATAATPTRVAIGGRAAPLVATVDDDTLEVVIPPGDQPGDAVVEVWNANGSAQATGLFRYSSPPTITDVRPSDLLYDRGGTITITGTGFVDEGVGDVTVVVDGRWAEAEVVDDTTVTVSVPPGRALARPDVELFDGRGRAIRRRAFRYAPSPRGGLVLFPAFGPFAVFFDPVDRSTVTVPAVGSALRFTAVVSDAAGDYWGADRSRRFGRIDMNAQTLEASAPTTGWYPTMIRVGADLIALDRAGLRLGRIDPATGEFAPLGAEAVPCCGSFALASGDGSYLVSRRDGVVAISPVDLATGELGPAVPLSGRPGVHIEEMRYFGGTLYAANRDGTLLTIEPATGVTTVVPVNIGRSRAMEVFTPAAAAP
jgi:hypothetical protein